MEVIEEVQIPAKKAKGSKSPDLSVAKMKTSAVWQYFTIDEKDKSKAVCVLCQMQVARGGAKPKSFSTQNLKKHLEVNHKQVIGAQVVQGLAPQTSFIIIQTNQPETKPVRKYQPILPKIPKPKEERVVHQNKVVQGGDSVDEFDNFCKSLAAKIRRIHSRSPRLAAELQYKIQEQTYLKEVEIYE